MSEPVKDPGWEIKVTEHRSSPEATGTFEAGWEPFAVWNANIYWRRRIFVDRVNNPQDKP